MTEARWVVPKPWVWARVGEIAQVVGGGTPSTDEPRNFASKGIPWVTPADLTGYRDAYIARGSRDLSEAGYRNCGAKLMPAGTVLFSSRAPIGYCAIASNEISTNQGFKSLILPHGISPEYARHYLIASVDYAKSKASGTTFQELSGSRVAELVLPVAPYPEQCRIVARIDSLSAKSRRACDQLDHVPRLVEKYKQAILAAAFRGELTRGWRENHPTPAVAFERKNVDQRANELGELPDTWCWTAMGDVASISGGLTKNSRRADLSLQVPYLRVANVYANELRLDDIAKIGCSDQELARTLLQQGDLLIVEGNGSLDQIGRVALWNDEISGCSHQNHIIRGRPGSDLMPSYALYWLLSPEGRKAIEAVASSSSGLHTLSISKVEGLPIPMCKPVEQREIIRAIEGALLWVNRVASETASARKLVDHLDLAILAKAFRGELVPQDPNDEPASVLLERISNERETIGTGSIRRPRKSK
jgi:type I restriction enzyme S subunit